MTPARRLQFQVLLLLVLLMAATGWAFMRLADRRTAAQDAADQLAEAQQLIAQIEALREKPVLAGVQEMPPTDLAQLIEQAAQQARLDTAQIVRIWPEPARRLGETPYRQKPTQLLLRNVSLEQLTRFLLQLVQGPYQLRVSGLRLSAPRSLAAGGAGDSGGNRWVAEVTLTYLLYSPAQDDAARPAWAQRNSQP